MDAPIYLSLAIIGNRQHPGLSRAAACLPDFFDALEKALAKDRRPLHLTLLTGLADGADMLAAEALVGWAAAKHVILRMVAALPFEAEEYLKTISDIKRHQALLEAASQRIILDGRYLPDSNGPEANELAATCRSRAYRQQARYLIESADLLLAIADEEQEGRTGGTLETVAAAIAQGLPVLFLSLRYGSFRWLTTVSDLGDRNDRDTAAVPDGLSDMAHYLSATYLVA